MVEQWVIINTRWPFVSGVVYLDVFFMPMPFGRSRVYVPTLDKSFSVNHSIGEADCAELDYEGEVIFQKSELSKVIDGLIREKELAIEQSNFDLNILKDLKKNANNG